MSYTAFLAPSHSLGTPPPATFTNNQVHLQYLHSSLPSHSHRKSTQPSRRIRSPRDIIRNYCPRLPLEHFSSSSLRRAQDICRDLLGNSRGNLLSIGQSIRLRNIASAGHYGTCLVGFAGHIVLSNSETGGRTYKRPVPHKRYNCPKFRADLVVKSARLGMTPVPPLRVEELRSTSKLHQDRGSKGGEGGLRLSWKSQNHKTS